MASIDDVTPTKPGCSRLLKMLLQKPIKLQQEIKGCKNVVLICLFFVWVSSKVALSVSSAVFSQVCGLAQSANHACCLSHSIYTDKTFLQKFVCTNNQNKSPEKSWYHYCSVPSTLPWINQGFCLSF